MLNYVHAPVLWNIMKCLGQVPTALALWSLTAAQRCYFMKTIFYFIVCRPHSLYHGNLLCPFLYQISLDQLVSHPGVTHSENLSLPKPLLYCQLSVVLIVHVCLPSLLLHPLTPTFSLTHSTPANMPWIKCIICQGRVRRGLPSLSITEQS